ncbi:enoyl-CoA hydratase [Capronia coronata CBS 617.96]|uniref:Enoyl-CoA hydratase n=1 Tax=Capronia coronata CBS 617.96 TaxID=1182541 RepID=W9Y297_9EURO|nr:enoyl-CoA hydratase [Capronia coronata CBS 617.96]EXJ83780.1 enoyl-CoA hydratase [Capronia coronata CBS 617.96]
MTSTNPDSNHATTFPTTTPPPKLPDTVLLQIPRPAILLVVLNNPRGLNCVSTPMHWALDAVLAWYDDEPSLRCCVITGMGRAFCAGADLKEWNQSVGEGEAQSAKGDTQSQQQQQQQQQQRQRTMPPSGFGGISRRLGKKPVIGAINGLAFGGGMEMVANMDMVVAAKGALFSLPEVKRGVVAIAGALPRIVRTLGRPRAMEMALTGRTVGAAEARDWGMVNAITDDAPPDSGILDRPVVKKALEYAQQICNNSPDSIIVSRAGVIAGWEDGSAEHGTQSIIDVYQKRLNQGENIREGLRAFVEKRAPAWVASKL